jgi:3-methylcrotonyl-CoA carboxylase beta subunit
MPVLKSEISTRGATYQANRKAMLEAIDIVAEASRLAIDGGGEKARERHVSRGKLLPRDRVAQLLDPGSPFLEVGLTAMRR